MKQITAIGVMLLGVLTLGQAMAAGPSSNVAWTVELQRTLKAGDPERGKALAGGCAGCHGATGVSPSPTFPSLAGQHAAYTYKQLRDYQDGKRANAMMQGMVAALSEEDMVHLSAFYATQPLPEPAGEGPSNAADIERLVKLGDGQRFVPACAACHWRHGEGDPRSIGMPAVAAQHKAYLLQTLRDYKTRNRANDVYSVMRAIAKNLSDEEIEGLASYYAAQSGK